MIEKFRILIFWGILCSLPALGQTLTQDIKGNVSPEPFQARGR